MALGRIAHLGIALPLVASAADAWGAVEYLVLRANVGDRVEWRPRISASAGSLRARRFIDQSGTYTGLSVDPRSGLVSGVAQGWWHHPGTQRMLSRSGTLDILVCQGPVITVEAIATVARVLERTSPPLRDPRFTNTARLSGPRFQFELDGKVLTTANTDLVNAWEFPADDQRGRPSGALFSINGRAFVSVPESREQGCGVVDPRVAGSGIRACEKARLPLVRVQSAVECGRRLPNARNACEDAVDSWINECASSPDVKKCLMGRLLSKPPVFADPEVECVPGETELRVAARYEIVDRSPFQVRGYPTTRWAAGVRETRQPGVSGGAPRYSFEAMRSIAPLRLDPRTGEISGVLSGGVIDSAIFLSDSQGRHEKLPFRAESYIEITPNASLCDYMDNCYKLIDRFAQRLNLAGVTLTNVRNGTSVNPIVNPIERVKLSRGYEISLYSEPGFRGREQIHRVPIDWSTPSQTFQVARGDVASFEFREAPRGEWPTRTFEGGHTHPSGTQPRWSEHAGGVANDNTHWYFTNQWCRNYDHTRSECVDAVIKVYKVPLTSDSMKKIDALWRDNSGCKHSGDPDFFEDELFVPLDDCGGENSRIIVFDRNLRHRRTIMLPHKRDMTFVAVDPRSGHLVTKKNGSTLSVWSRFDVSPGTELYTVSLPGQLGWLQGADISESGTLYVVAEKVAGRWQAGIYVYRLRGASAQPLLHGEGANRTNRIPLRYHGAAEISVSAPGYQRTYRQNEFQGMTLWDLNNRNVRNALRGQIHVIKLNLEAFDRDYVYFRHIRVNPRDLL